VRQGRCRTDPLTGREIRLRRTCRTERAAQIELGKLLEQTGAGRRPETNAAAAQLIDRYAEIADWDLATHRKANEVYIRRVIMPALGHLQVHKIRRPLLDLHHAQLERCSNPGYTSKRSIALRDALPPRPCQLAPRPNEVPTYEPDVVITSEWSRPVGNSLTASFADHPFLFAVEGPNVEPRRVSRQPSLGFLGGRTLLG
jgi:hypothetical protein